MHNTSFDLSAEAKSIYIHWPFCPYKCSFCPFVAIAGQDQFMEQYHFALKKEILNYFLNILKKNSLSTIYIGGGTPSTYPLNLLLDMFDTLKEQVTFDENIEISLEVNPGTVDEEKLHFWKKIGINRLSLGVQSLDNKVLTDLNRLQKREDVYWFLSKAGNIFENISIDLILGLPGVSDEEWKALIKEVVNWPIKHISIYFLTIHENTPLFFRLKKNQISLPCEDSIVDLYFWTINFLSENGFLQYETSSFCKPGFESKHNSVYWEHKPYKAFGIGACSFDGQTRFQNDKNLLEYIRKCTESLNCEVFAENLSVEQLKLERIMLGLRQLNRGVNLNYVLEGLSKSKINDKLDYINSLISKGLLIQRDGRLFLTPSGVILENEIVVNLSE